MDTLRRRSPEVDLRPTGFNDLEGGKEATTQSEKQVSGAGKKRRKKGMGEIEIAAFSSFRIARTARRNLFSSKVKVRPKDERS